MPTKRPNNKPRRLPKPGDDSADTITLRIGDHPVPVTASAQYPLSNED